MSMDDDSDDSDDKKPAAKPEVTPECGFLTMFPIKTRTPATASQSTMKWKSFGTARYPLITHYASKE